MALECIKLNMMWQEPSGSNGYQLCLSLHYHSLSLEIPWYDWLLKGKRDRWCVMYARMRAHIVRSNYRVRPRSTREPSADR